MIIKRLYDFTLFNATAKRIAMSFLNSKVLTKNFLYKYFHKKQMKEIMQRTQNAPLQIMIENTNACNAKCPFCPHFKMKRKVGFMNPDLFKRIIDECIKIGVSFVDIHGFGEPLLDRDFSNKVAYAKSKGIKTVRTNTNASLLKKDLIKKILDARLDQIYISLDAATKNTYNKIRPPLDFDIVEKNVNDLVRLKAVRDSKKPEIILDFVQAPENRSEVRKYISKWKNVVDKICISYMHDWAESIEYKDQDTVYGSMRSRIPCRLLWTDMIISWDGHVPLCCVDYDNEVILGDIKKSKISEIWSSEKLKEIRKAHLSNRFDELSLCSKCQYMSVWWM